MAGVWGHPFSDFEFSILIYEVVYNFYVCDILISFDIININVQPSQNVLIIYFITRYEDPSGINVLRYIKRNSFTIVGCISFVTVERIQWFRARGMQYLP